MPIKPSIHFMLITRPFQDQEAYLTFIKDCVKFGVDCVQLREKSPTTETREFARNLRDFLKNAQIPLIINDNVEWAKELEADGVHLGQSDTNVQKARQILGEDKILGLSIETLEELEEAQNLDVDYVACSAVFPTSSKNDLKTLWGLEGLRIVCQRSVHPVLAIGGITEKNTKSVIEAGASGVAVIAALHEAQNLEQTITTIKQALEARKR